MAEPETFDPAEVDAAEALDHQIDAVLSGHAPSDVAPTLTWLAAAVRTDVPVSVGARVHAEADRLDRRRWRPARYAAAVLAYLFISQGIGNLAAGSWVADGIGEAYSPHVMREGGFALIAAGLAVAAGAVSRRMAPVSTAAGVPLGLALGVSGVAEIGQFAAGAVLHLSEGLVAALLAYTFWRFRRDRSVPADEEGA